MFLKVLLKVGVSVGSPWLGDKYEVENGVLLNYIDVQLLTTLTIVLSLVFPGKKSHKKRKSENNIFLVLNLNSV